jgi:transposase-like protein
VLGLAVGDSEDGAFWTAFPRSLRARSVGGVRLVVSDAHEGLNGAIAAVLLGAAWQRCKVHLLRNALARIPKGSPQMALAAIRTIWAEPDPAAGADQLDEVAAKLEPRFPAVAAMLTGTKADLAEGSMALLDRAADDGATKEVNGANSLLLAS